MKLKGFDTFREKTPWFAGKRIILLPLYLIFMLALSLSIMIWFDSLPDKLISAGINPTILSLFPLFGELLIAVIGFTMVYQMWFWRERVKKKYGRLSYQRMALVGFGGIILVLSLGVNLFIDFSSFSPLFWASSPLRFLTVPLETFAGGAGLVVFWVRMVASVLLLIAGLGIAVRSLYTFGFDYMTVVYLYFPEESRIQNHEIYSVLRHPTYAGGLMIGLAGMFFTFTVYSIIFFIVFLAGFYIHIHFVEEKELIKRFGPSYQEYMKRVPALFASPAKTAILLRFLLGKPGLDTQS